MSPTMLAFLIFAGLVALAVVALLWDNRRFADICLNCGHPRDEHTGRISGDHPNVFIHNRCQREQCNCEEIVPIHDA